MQNEKPAPGGNRAAGYRCDLNSADRSPKLSENQAQTYAQRLGGDHFGASITCPGPGHGPRDRSLSIRLNGRAPDGFLLHSFAGDNWRICRDHVKTALGLRTYSPYSQPIQKPARNAVIQYTDNSRTDYALRIWNDSHPLNGTLAGRYLTSRSISHGGNFDHALRFHPACPFGAGVRLPCLVALFRDIRTDAPCGIHRTALTSDAKKIDRKMLGVCRDAAIKLSPDYAVQLGIGEGIETSLSVMQAGMKPVWALGSAGAISRFPALPGIENLSIFADHDQAGLEAASNCARLWRDAGKSVRIVCPRIVGTDFNDRVGHE